jgi:hypothetical protein
MFFVSLYDTDILQEENPNLGLFIKVVRSETKVMKTGYRVTKILDLLAILKQRTEPEAHYKYNQKASSTLNNKNMCYF